MQFKKINALKRKFVFMLRKIIYLFKYIYLISSSKNTEHEYTIITTVCNTETYFVNYNSKCRL